MNFSQLSDGDAKHKKDLFSSFLEKIEVEQGQAPESDGKKLSLYSQYSLDIADRYKLPKCWVGDRSCFMYRLVANGEVIFDYHGSVSVYHPKLLDKDSKESLKTFEKRLNRYIVFQEHLNRLFPTSKLACRRQSRSLKRAFARITEKEQDNVNKLLKSWSAEKAEKAFELLEKSVIEKDLDKSPDNEDKSLDNSLKPLLEVLPPFVRDEFIIQGEEAQDMIAKDLDLAKRLGVVAVVTTIIFAPMGILIGLGALIYLAKNLNKSKRERKEANKALKNIGPITDEEAESFFQEYLNDLLPTSKLACRRQSRSLKKAFARITQKERYNVNKLLKSWWAEELAEEAEKAFKLLEESVIKGDFDESLDNRLEPLFRMRCQFVRDEFITQAREAQDMIAKDLDLAKRLGVVTVVTTIISPPIGVLIGLVAFIYLAKNLNKSKRKYREATEALADIEKITNKPVVDEKTAQYFSKSQSTTEGKENTKDEKNQSIERKKNSTAIFV